MITKFIIIRKIKLFFLVILGIIYKFGINLYIIRPRNIKNNSKSQKSEVIVSLTSYGRRVKNVKYTIISLLRQSFKPDIIILWLDNEHWNWSNLPKSIKKLTQCGLTVKFCQDLKSYKKLIPTLKEFPDSLIITCDDDIYYRKNMVQRLVEAYKKDPTKIYAHRAHEITFANGKINPYNDWIEEVSNVKGKNIFPTSGGGTLYTKNLLYKDTCNELLFKKLSPNADDIWNYFMGYLQGTENVVIPHKGYIYIPLDVFYQAIHKGANLTSINCGESMNDSQIRSVMKFYGIQDSDLF